MSNVHALQPKSRRSRAKGPKRGFVMSKTVKRNQKFAARFFGALVIILTALSLVHFAKGVMVITGEHIALAVALAIAIEAGYIGIEIARAALPREMWEPLARQMEWTSRALLALSAGMNVFAFTAHATNNYYVAAGVIFGIAVPILIYMLARFSITLAQYR